MNNDQVLYSANSEYISHIFARYCDNPETVDPSWLQLFDSLDQEPSFLSRKPYDHNLTQLPVKRGKDQQRMEINQASLDSIRALMLIRVYRVRGHLMAQLDPLELEKRSPHPELDPKSYGFTPQDYDRPIFVNGSLGLTKPTPLRTILEILQQTYCHHIGVEFMHIQDPDQKQWIQRRIEEIRNQTLFTFKGKRTILERLIQAVTFEEYLHKKYPNTKRFGLDGGEVLIPAIEQILKKGGELGIQEVVIGMSHRGRLNVLAHVMRQPLVTIFRAFQEYPSQAEEMERSGDVKYHLGASSDRQFDNNTIHLSLTANPSHLEIVDPVVLGKVKAKQILEYNSDPQKALGLLLHGDAAFAGQGIVAETFALAALKGYTIGGTVHIVINNQIGFTTRPVFARSSTYPTDVSKIIQAPIFHVNGDDPEAVVHVARIAIEFRQEFGQDVVINMCCYRRFGHNEGDEPRFTQPLMYEKIGQKPTISQIYSKTLLQEKVFTPNEITVFTNKTLQELEDAFASVASYRTNKSEWLTGNWYGFGTSYQEEKVTQGHTAILREDLEPLSQVLYTIPEEFTIHSKLKRQLKEKKARLETGKGIDWATAEALAFGSLLSEGTSIRLSGQDCGRGTFSHRHAVWYDQNTEKVYIPLQHLGEKKALFQVYDSPLSEAGVLGFEYGYSLVSPHNLVIWEAQFGDFVNGAQVIIDQFITSAESKWLRLSGIVLLLPHGHEGQGPEHSSARPERFLQLCAESNIQIANCTTPANYFHILRRQIHRNLRKPLIIFTPKSLLRDKRCVSTFDDITGHSCFQRVLDDVSLQAQKVERIILCSGKIYYDLFAERKSQQAYDTALIRVEQLYPFPFSLMEKILSTYTNAQEIIWCQEEPENMGAWYFIDRRLEKVLKTLNFSVSRPRYVGRPDLASPAAGTHKKHLAEQNKLLKEAFS